MIETFGVYMIENGWNIECNEGQGEYLPETIIKRYKNIPKQWREFIGGIKCMMSSDDTTWFLCAEDFVTQSDEAFQWNEWELLSLESVEDDTKWQNEIRKFWDNHLPIVMSVKGCYSYYAIAIKDGSIVHGSEPEFEECEIVAPSFMYFMEKIVKGEIQL
ncbi:MAG: SMI1/KNR4 family protein [Lachnospiraceae bacterium]|nr:SMI1/KNR4 family protein [Lachnospiraceae bacterium]